MNSNYNNYIFIIIILAIVIPVCLLIILHKRCMRTGKPEVPVVVNGGNISIFFDKAGNVTMIPYVKDKFGNGRATSNVVMVRMPYAPDMLGYTVKKSLNGCKKSTPCTNGELLGKLDVVDWKQFSGDKRNISLYFREGYGLVFNTTTRKPDGAYQFNIIGAEKTIPADIGDAVLGNTILQLLEKCR